MRNKNEEEYEGSDFIGKWEEVPEYRGRGVI
jgi:hypothetical protein